MADYYSDSDQIREAAVSYALAQVGKPYSYTANPPNTWDCTKLTSWAYSNASNGRIQLTAYSYTQAEEVDKFYPNIGGSASEFQLGDLLFFFKNGSHHASMYIGNGQIVEASSPEVGVRTTTLWNSWNSANFSWAGRPHRIGPYGGTGYTPGSNAEDTGGDDDRIAIAKKSARKVNKNALAVSRVAGTPQTARFAVMNVANESIFLTQDSSSAITKTQFSLSARAITPGDTKELIVPLDNGQNGYQVILESDIIQSEDQARALASMISRSLDTEIDSINVSIFGNPLLQLGDIVKFNFNNKKITSSADEFYIITSIAQNFQEGLATDITIKPLKQTVSVL